MAPPYMATLEKLCHDAKTLKEAERILLIARANTGAGSGFDLGENRTGLPAVCAYIASQNLNNTNVTIEAAQIASCQTMLKFKKLRERVDKALAARKPARRGPLTFKTLIPAQCPRISLQAVGLMDEVEVTVREKMDADNDDTCSDDEITCAVFAWVCNVLEGQRLFKPTSFEGTYDVDADNMQHLNKLIKATCRRDREAQIREDYNKPAAPVKSASTSPRKSPSKPLRELPSRDSPQKRKVASPDADDALPLPDSPSKRQKVASSSLVTLETILRTTRSMSASPTKLLPAPSTPRKAQRLPSSPSKSPTKPQAAATPTRVIRLLPMDAVPPLSDSSEDEDAAPPPRRRFRPVFRDQQQWARCDPRLTKLARAAAEHHRTMIKRHGAPFQDYRRAEDSDIVIESD
ncbi:hypothetical protein FB451DRAFT_1576162 [Mycena latifolia]|nr:hypothetical protein FB451DRAFT_1576162 [Mycena latifolia]